MSRPVSVFADPQPPTLVMVAHGTRAPAGVQTIAELATAVSARVGPVRTAFVDVLGPSPCEVLATTAGAAIVLPAFLASGFHVHTDLPAHVARSGHRDTTVTSTLGPDSRLAAVLRDRLREAGWRPGEAVVMAAAGSSDPIARHEVRCAAALLGELIGDVHLAYITTGTPTVPEVITHMRSARAGRVVVAPYLLAPGFFHTRLIQSGADVVAAPLGVHPGVVDLLAARFTAALTARPNHPGSVKRPTRRSLPAASRVVTARCPAEAVPANRGREADPMMDWNSP